MRAFKYFAPASLVLISLGCSSSRLYLPEGDAQAGRQAFLDRGCYACHRVEGESFPEPVATPPVPVVLGSSRNRKTRAYLAESIIAPSHRFARPQPRPVGDPPQVMEWPEYKDIRDYDGDESRMGDYNQALTVKQWLDLVAFLEHCQSQ